ncbi:uncharacterized protein LOC119580933 [Penaeus monodon]|uniref:uncharacterized protein LOC119580933 n=1 Tax=Penaeus monodon TaxID=6687 RepID=UPI0018A79C0B|nr:uncharacterized protein LOC119580933 [Penaeus monodon]
MMMMKMRMMRMMMEIFPSMIFGEMLMMTTQPKMTRVRMVKNWMTPLGKVTHLQDQGQGPVTGQGQNPDRGHIPQEGGVPGPTQGHVPALPDLPILDLGPRGLPQGHGQGHVGGEATLHPDPPAQGGGDIGQGHGIVQVRREGEDHAGLAPVLAPGRDHIPGTASIQGSRNEPLLEILYKGGFIHAHARPKLAALNAFIM